MLYALLRFVHILFMATWFGAGLFAAGDIRRTLATEGASRDLLRQRVNRVSTVTAVSAVVTVLSGVALIVYLGGFAVVPWPIHAGLLLGVILWAVGGVVVGRTWSQIDKLLAEGKESELGPLVKRMNMGLGTHHALWLLTLVLMVFRNVIAG